MKGLSRGGGGKFLCIISGNVHLNHVIKGPRL